MSRYKELIERWNSDEFARLRYDIIRFLKSGRSLANIGGLGKVNGRWDLRGIKISETSGSKDGTLQARFDRCQILNADLSHAILTGGDWIRGFFNDVLFMNVKMNKSRFTDCVFENVIFEDSDLSRSSMGLNIGGNSGSFSNTFFVRSNLKECSFCFPDIYDSVFDNCNLFATDFDGSRLRRVKFIGTVDSAFFRGYSVFAQKSIFGIFHRVNPRDHPNRMLDVDFSEAELRGVSFTNGIDLQFCQFPKSDNYIILKDLESVYSRLLQLVEQSEDIDKDKAKRYINNMYYKDSRKGQFMDIVDTSLVLDAAGDPGFSLKFFSLMRQAANKENY